MKKGLMKIVILALVILSVLVLALSFLAKRPFKNLSADDIIFAKVNLVPPDIILEIEDKNYLTECLNQTVIYKKDNSWRDYAGQSVEFTLFLKDGKEISVMPFGDFFVIDGEGYKCKYEVSNKLNNFANNLLEKKQDSVLLENPPLLDVISDNICISTDVGSFKWQRRSSYFEEGLKDTEITEFDLSAYLNNQSELPILDTSSPVGELRFKFKPDRISSLTIYDLESRAVAGTTDITGNFFDIKEGKYIYEVKASWDEKNGFGGDAAYYFAINKIS